MLAIVDYGVGNLFSLKSSLAAIGEQAIVSSSPQEIATADKIILPGVGAFGDAKAKLSERGLDRVVIEQANLGKPLLGICLGMQLLFEGGLEYGEHKGLGLISGTVSDMRDVVPKGLKVPHIGWNELNITRQTPLFRYISNGDCVYFVHSFHGTDCTADTIATTDYGAPITAAVARGNVMGCQFHPEKSGTVGLNILRGFCNL